MLRNVSIGNRIVAILVVMSLFIVSTGVAFLFNSKMIRDISIGKVESLMLEGHKGRLKLATDTLAQSLGELLEGAPDEETRIQRIRKAIADIRFEGDKSGYYFVFEGTKTIAHAADPSLHGKDLGDMKDQNGVYMIRELAKKAAQGGGFIQYVWEKPGNGIQPKLSYSTKISGTNYNIGTGVYIDNVEREKAGIDSEIDELVVQNTMIIVGGLCCVLLLIVLPLSMLVVRSITGPIVEATEAAEKIAGGDYSAHLSVTGKDEAAKLEGALNAMSATLQENITEITAKTAEAEEKANAAEVAMAEAKEARAEAEQARKKGILQAAERIQSVVDRVSASAEQMARQADIISEGTTVQRDRVQSTATAMEEMNATVLEVARNASDASGTGHKAKELAVSGSEAVSRSVEAMNATFSAADSLKGGMNKLGEQTDDIGKVMNVITDIADQTNLLALNAAIEAARAGEAGRGFAVVADEVRKLAEKTMQATKEVGDSISAVQSVAQDNITGMDRALSDLHTAVTLSDQSGEVLKDIVVGAEESALQIQSIATAAEEQSAASEEINHAIEEINSISLETSEGILESSEAIREMVGQMAELQGVIDNLVEGSKS